MKEGMETDRSHRGGEERVKLYALFTIIRTLINIGTSLHHMHDSILLYLV